MEYEDDKIDINNAFGVMFGDVFWLDYHGINVFFEVVGCDFDKVNVYELATHHKDGKQWIPYPVKGAKNPLVVKGCSNCWTKTWFWVKTVPHPDGSGSPCLAIPVTIGDPLYEKAKSLGVMFPSTGIMLATYPVEENKTGICNYYWNCRQNKSKKK